MIEIYKTDLDNKLVQIEESEWTANSTQKIVG